MANSDLGSDGPQDSVDDNEFYEDGSLWDGRGRKLVVYSPEHEFLPEISHESVTGERPTILPPMMPNTGVSYATAPMNHLSYQETYEESRSKDSREIFESVRKQLSQLNEQDIHDLIINSDDSLRKVISGDVNRQVRNGIEAANVDYVINSIGNDEAAWTDLAARHEGLRTYLSLYHQRKMQEESDLNTKKRKRQGPQQAAKKKMKMERKIAKKFEKKDKKRDEVQDERDDDTAREVQKLLMDISRTSGKMRTRINF